MPGRERHSQGRHGEEVAVSGALKSTIGREEPRTAHALHTSHTLVIRRPCQKCRFWLCRSRRGGRHSAFLTGSLVMLMSLALRTNLGLWGCLPVLPWPLRWGLAWDLWHRLGMRSVVKWSGGWEPKTDWVLGARAPHLSVITGPLNQPLGLFFLLKSSFKSSPGNFLLTPVLLYDLQALGIYC